MLISYVREPAGLKVVQGGENSKWTYVLYFDVINSENLPKILEIFNILFVFSFSILFKKEKITISEWLKWNEL